MTGHPGPLPQIDRPDAGLVLISRWYVGTPDQQRAVLDHSLGRWDQLPWPDGLLSVNGYTSTDGDTVMTYAQWTSDKAFRLFDQARPAIDGPVTEACPG
ncbi:hypothetical protein GCM10012275_45670 [Longimycelium tulufanense]|uniref:ABM domain-containing protein n=1 Tax=Longimycelium tulufanense TaxID=907463 RepID=A0A8J3CHG6_9PSEU|nr:hypothetical protein [Longimycelium tulufanense]GGM70085.1 hypothetical protein GCM10012275_45670 [Longimycelium tulufanense]